MSDTDCKLLNFLSAADKIYKIQAMGFFFASPTGGGGRRPEGGCLGGM